MEQEIVSYCKAAFIGYADGIQKLHTDLKHTADDSLTRLKECRRRYDRLWNALEAKISQARRNLYDAEADARDARARYERASRDASSEDPQVQSGASREMSRARQDELEADRRAAKARAELTDARSKQMQLDKVWNAHYPQARNLEQKMEASLSGFSRLKEDSRKDLDHYAELMERARRILHDYSFGTGSRSSGGSSTGSTGNTAAEDPPDISIPLPADLGWCPRNSMKAVRLEEDGTKTVTLTVGGESRTYSCDRRGIANAYAEASRCRDFEMIPVTSAMFEIEDLRANLELTAGDTDVPQLGGYHRDVKEQDGAGYESHHIPAQSVQSTHANWLPTISITEADHALTPSYRGKSKYAHESFVPKSWEKTTYRQSMSKKISQGSSGYIHAVKCEILELRERFGNKYDGAISAFLDAVLDMLSTRGIPDVRE